VFAIKFIRDFIAHKHKVWNGLPGNNLFFATWAPVAFFLSTFEISAFTLLTIVYRAKNLLMTKNSRKPLTPSL